MSVALAACDGQTPPSEDAGRWSDAESTPTAEAPALPVLGPCPEGWVEAPVDDAGLTACAPWPERAASECPRGTAAFVGASGCAPIGRECPTGRFPPSEALPPGAALYVDGIEGSFTGAGSAADPFFFVEDALDVASPGTTVVLARGTYREQVVLRQGVSLVGACAAETIIEAPPFTDAEIPVATGAVTVVGSGVHLRGVTLTGRRIGLRVEPLESPAEVTVDGVLIDGASFAGIFAGFGGRVRGSDLVVRSTAGIDGDLGGGIVVGRDSAATLSRVVVRDNATVGVSASGGRVELHSAVIADTVAFPAGRFGRGLNVVDGGSLRLTDSWVGDNHECGFAVDGGSMVAEGVVVAGDPAAVDRFACGSFVRGASTLSASRLWVRDVVNHAVTSSEPGAAVTLEDVLVTDVRATPGDAMTGWGLASSGPAELTVRRAMILRATGVAVSIAGASRGSLSDVSIRDTQSHEPSARGYGVEVSQSGSLIASRLAIEDSVGVALVAFGAGSSATLTDLSVRGSSESPCADCLGGLGAGVASVRGSRIHVERFRIEETTCGVQVIDGGELDMMTGVIAGNDVGACLQSEGFDVARIGDGVVYGGSPQRNVDRSDRGSVSPAIPGLLTGD